MLNRIRLPSSESHNGLPSRDKDKNRNGFEIFISNLSITMLKVEQDMTLRKISISRLIDRRRKYMQHKI